MVASFCKNIQDIFVQSIICYFLKIDPTGSVLIVGFADGIIRVISLQLSDKTMDLFQLIQVTKCHHMPITKLAINPKGTIIVSGSEDKTVFIHQIDNIKPYVTLVPIGFIKVPAPVTCFNWNQKKVSVIIGSISLKFQTNFPTVFHSNCWL